MAKKSLTDIKLRAIVDNEIREAMGELSGELANDRSRAMDYYHGEASGKLAPVSTDRSDIVMTTVRDTVEWIMPELMRTFAQADKVVEFEAMGAEDEDQAEQETRALNHIFWRQNPGFLILYSWFKDALLQKNGTVKWWIDDSETKSREEYDGLTPVALQELMQDPELEAKEREPSEIPSISGELLEHIVFERTKKKQRICIEVIPPEEFLVSADCRSINIREANPRFVGHFMQKTRTELLDMGFSEEDVDLMASGGGEFIEEWDEEYYARYNLTDEQQHIHGSEPHESQKKIKLVEGYMRLDEDGDGYAELIRIWRAGDYCESEEADQIPFASLTPNILTHKFYGFSIADQVSDLQEIGTQILRNMLDNLVMTNNVRPVINNNVDLDQLLISNPGSPIYVTTETPVQEAIMPFAPPPMWADGLQMMEWLEGIRKDRIGVGDEVQGLDPKTLANANTGVVTQALEAARAKVELIARIFAETGAKWMFQGIHELARKSYDQPLRYKLENKYVAVNPQEWRERDDIVVQVGTATGSQQRELAALESIAMDQAAMIQAGGLGVTVLPSNIYKTAVDKAKAMGKKDADQYFMDPMLRADPQFMQMVQVQMPQQQDPSAGLIQANMQIEQGKAQVAMQKAQMEAQIKQAELMLKREELGVKTDIESMKQRLSMQSDQAKNATEMEKAAIKAETDSIAQTIKAMEAQWKARHDAQSLVIDKYQADIAALTAMEQKRMDIVGHTEEMAAQVTESAGEAAKSAAHAKITSATLQDTLNQVGQMIASLRDEIAKPTALVEELRDHMYRPRTVERDENGRVISVGGRPVDYDDEGRIRGMG